MKNDLREAQTDIIASVAITVTAAISVADRSDYLNFCGMSCDGPDQFQISSLPKQATAN